MWGLDPWSPRHTSFGGRHQGRVVQKSGHWNLLLGLVTHKVHRVEGGTNPSSLSSTRKVLLDHMELLGWMGHNATMSSLRVSSPMVVWLKATHSSPLCITSMSLHAQKSDGAPCESGMLAITMIWPSSAMGYGQYGLWSWGILHTTSVSSPRVIRLQQMPRASGTQCSSWQFGTHTTMAEKIKYPMLGGSMLLLLRVQQTSKVRLLSYLPREESHAVPVLHSICSALSKSSMVVRHDTSA